MSIENNEYIDIPALLGYDVNRYPGSFVVEVIDGKPHDPDGYGEEIVVVSKSEMMGWGDLSGPSYSLSNGADVNAEDWPFEVNL